MFKLFNVACKWNHHLWKTLIFTGNKKRPWPAEITPQKANLCKIKVFILYCLIWQHFITLLGHTMHDQLMHCHRILPREASAGSRQNSSENHPMYTQDSHFPGYGFCPKTGYMALPCDKILSQGNTLHPLRGKSFHPPLYPIKALCLDLKLIKSYSIKISHVYIRRII